MRGTTNRQTYFCASGLTRHCTKVLSTNAGFLYRIPAFVMKKLIPSKIARGSAELAILSLLDQQALYGFEICRLIEENSGGALRFTLASLYPMLYELEKRGWLSARWEANQEGRDRRYYRLTPEGKKQLPSLRREWHAFFVALDRLAGVSHA